MKHRNSSLTFQVEEYDEVENLVREIKKESEEKKNKKKSGIFAFMCAVYIVAIVASLLFKTVDINEQKISLSAMEEEYNELCTCNKKLEVDINSKIDLRKVEEIAIAQLDMNQPKKSQIVYINTEPKEYGVVVGAEDGKSDKSGGVLASLIKSLNGYYAYSN